MKLWLWGVDQHFRWLEFSWLLVFLPCAKSNTITSWSWLCICGLSKDIPLVIWPFLPTYVTQVIMVVLSLFIYSSLITTCVKYKSYLGNTVSVLYLNIYVLHMHGGIPQSTPVSTHKPKTCNVLFKIPQRRFVGGALITEQIEQRKYETTTRCETQLNGLKPQRAQRP